MFVLGPYWGIFNPAILGGFHAGDNISYSRLNYSATNGAINRMA